MRMPEDMSGLMTLLNAMKEAQESLDEPVGAQFPTEEEALQYARRLSQLKKGDCIIVHGTKRSRTKGIVIGFNAEKGQVVLLRYDEDKELSTMSAPYRAIEIVN